MTSSTMPNEEQDEVPETCQKCGKPMAWENRRWGWVCVPCGEFYEEEDQADI